MTFRNELVFEGFVGDYIFDEENQEYYGRVANSQDVITFVGSSLEELEYEFKESCIDYLNMLQDEENSND